MGVLLCKADSQLTQLLAMPAQVIPMQAQHAAPLLPCHVVALKICDLLQHSWMPKHAAFKVVFTINLNDELATKYVNIHTARPALNGLALESIGTTANCPVQPCVEFCLVPAETL
jgi:hypothetical protein